MLGKECRASAVFKTRPMRCYCGWQVNRTVDQFFFEEVYLMGVMQREQSQANGRKRLLCSWKEIASYLGLGVRTVQRYERELGMPVRRSESNSRSEVRASRSEIDTWWLVKTQDEPPAPLRFAGHVKRTKEARAAAQSV